MPINHQLIIFKRSVFIFIFLFIQQSSSQSLVKYISFYNFFSEVLRFSYKNKIIFNKCACINTYLSVSSQNIYIDLGKQSRIFRYMPIHHSHHFQMTKINTDSKLLLVVNLLNFTQK